MRHDQDVSADQMAQLRALSEREPDIHDIPDAPDKNWGRADHAALYKARKEAISLRIDMDVLHWLRRRGPGYQTEINRILRERMMANDASA